MAEFYYEQIIEYHRIKRRIDKDNPRVEFSLRECCGDC